ncbi:MAG: ABC transporter substrate-binding protein [Anaerolineae bacterium]|nr:ABC transporter substrate-binding protein [Anaerolineae bacterium]
MSFSRRDFLKITGAAGAAASFSSLPIGRLAAQSGDVTVVWWQSHGGALGELLNALAQEFNDMDNGITIQVEYQGGYTDTMDKVITSAAAGALPDMLHVGDGQYPPLARNGILLPLDDLINGPNGINLDEYSAPVYRGVLDGKMYQLAYGVSTPIFYYNVEALEEAGLDGPPETWDAFFDDYLPKLTKEGRFAFAYSPGSWWQQTAYWSNGIMVNDENWEIDLANPAAVSWFSRMQQARQNDQVKFPSPTDEGGGSGIFGSGSAAMLIESTGLIGNVDNLVGGAFTAQVGFLPGGSAGRFVPSGGNGLSIINGVSDEKRDAAWEFIKFLHAPDQYSRYDELSGYIPITESTAAKLADVLQSDPRRQVAIDQFEFSRWHMRFHTLARGEQALANAWNDCVQTDISVQERLDQLQEEAIEIIHDAGFEPTLPTS